MKNGIIYHSSSTTPPPSPVTGTVYFDQTTALYKIYNGVGWVTLSGDECTEEMDPTEPVRELLASSVDIDDPFIAEVRDELIMRLKLITEFKTEP